MAVGSVEEAMEILKRSSLARQKAATALNYGSSRSHSIFSLAVFGPSDADDTASNAGQSPPLLCMKNLIISRG